MLDIPLTRRAPTRFRLKQVLTGTAIAGSLALGACAGATNPFDFASADKPAPQSDVTTGSVPQTELQKATEYWGKQYEKNPKDAQAAVNYVRNLKALGFKDQAYAILQQAYTVNPSHKGIASEYGRAALDQDQLALAEKLLAMADDPVSPDWKVLSARGTLLAKQGKYRDAVPHFERALALQPSQPSLLNNLALAYAMDGHAEKAEPLLRQAAADSTADPKIGHNLALVLGLQGKTEDAKSVRLVTASTEEAAEDAALVKQMVGTTSAPARTTPISTGSTAPLKARAPAKAATAAKPKLAEAVSDDPAVLVQRLADGYAATPPDAPVQLQPRR